MIDMHSHILHRIDDGSESYQMSCQMIDDAVEAGVSYMFATSHFIPHDMKYTVEDLKNRADELNQYCKEQRYDFEVILGHEILIDHNLMTYLEDGFALALGRSRYLLIEFPMYDIPVYTKHILHELKIAGHRPIIAHPERNMKMIEDPNRLFELLECGALAQLNLKSLTGKYGKTVKETAEIFLRHEMYHFIGSDAHRPTRDSKFMGRELNRLRDIVDGSVYDALTEGNPYAVMIDSNTITSNHTQYLPLTFVQQFLDRFRRHTA